MSIVVVEDDDGIRNALQDALRAEGYATAAAANGEQALDLLRRAEPPPRLILLDLMMPVMDGWELLKEIDEEPRLRGICVTIMSAHSSIRRALENGRRKDGSPELLLHGMRLRLLPKPMNLVQLLSVARDACSGVQLPSCPGGND